MIDTNTVESVRTLVMEINAILAKGEITNEDKVTLDMLKKSMVFYIIDLLNQVNEL